MAVSVPPSDSALLAERERIEVLRRIEILDTPCEEEFDDLVALAAELCGAPVALMTLVDSDRVFHKAAAGADPGDVPREESFCTHAITDGDLTIVPDASADPRFAANPNVTDGLGVRFYAGAPLVTPEGAAIGSLCVIDHRPRELTPDQERALRAVSRAVVAQLELRRRNARLKAPDRNSDRLQRLAGDLLLLARSEAGKLELDLRPTDVAAVVCEAAEAARPAAEAKGIALEVAVGDVPPVRADRERLAQMLDNLVSNAVKFTPAGGSVTLLLGARLDADAVTIDVADTGAGISADELPLLFTRFSRARAATEAGVPGTGLGLAIAKTIVEGHGGTIAVDSAEGEGARFRVTLPLNA